MSHISVTKEDITYAEKVLLPHGEHFDDDRIKFIKKFDTLDLQAVPGSGKTTALLAKLLIIERKLPFKGGSGILVISHTNAAVDEIKRKLGNCSKIFSYPNFIGTIQGFVNEFLAVPYFCQKYQKKPVRIDNEIYEEIASKKFKSFKGPAKTWISRKRNPEEYFIDLRFDTHGNLREGVDGKVCLRKSSDSATYKYFRDAKLNILRNGFLNFDDSYLLAEFYLKEFPEIKKIIQKRFPYVFVDEMQDMDVHQYNLIEKLFFDDGLSLSKIQRIGDKNQSIYNTVKTIDVWKDRDVVLPLSQSMRLSGPISRVVTNFALYREEGYTINGRNNCQLKPHLLIYDDDSLKDVIPHFSYLVSSHYQRGVLSDLDRYPAKVIAWNTDWKEDIDRDGKIRLADYHDFSKEKAKPKNDYTNLKSYLLYYDKAKKTLEAIRKNILNAFLKVFRLENIYYEENRSFTKRLLLSNLKESHADIYDDFKLNLYNWCVGIYKGNIKINLAEIRAYLPSFVKLFSEIELKNSLPFINDEAEMDNSTEERHVVRNVYDRDGIEIELTSVHAVKGQTHSATLYVESFYERGYGNYESERLRNQFNGKHTLAQTISTIRTSHDLIKQSAKMAFVGFSRPTSLLCVAIHKKRFESHLSSFKRDDWDLIEVPSSYRRRAEPRESI